MATYVVIGTAPDVDTSVVVGPFRSIERARSVSEDMDQFGYVTEVAECQTLAEVGYADWSDDGSHEGQS